MKDYGLKKLHNKILEIIVYIDKICKENGITYYLSGGCALGAMRHSGFIPWDDDMDIFMTSNNYYRFLEICRRKVGEDFYLQEENTNEWPLLFSKLRLEGTTYIESYNKDLEMHKGIFVDIYRLDNVSNNRFLAFAQYLCSKVLVARRLPKINYQTTSLTKKIFILLSFAIPISMEKRLFYFIKKYNNQETCQVANFFHRGSFKSNRFPIAWLGEPRYVDFENIRLPVPVCVEGILEKRFGNYMKIPDEKDRKIMPHVEYYSVDTSYAEYKVEGG